MAKAGLCTIACQDKSVFKAIDMAKSAGAESIEIWGKPGHINYPVNKDELLKIKEYAQSKEIPICALGSYFHAGVKTHINNVELTMDNQIEIAKLLNTGIIRIWAGEKNYNDYTKDEIEVILAEIRAFGELAGRENIVVVLERHSNNLTNQWDNIEYILEKIDSSNVFLNYQIPNPATVKEYKTKSIDDYTNFLKYSRHAHLQNYAKEDSHKRTFLDTGIVDYSKLGEAVEKSGYEGYFMVEFPAKTNNGLNKVDILRRDIEFIKDL